MASAASSAMRIDSAAMRRFMSITSCTLSRISSLWAATNAAHAQRSGLPGAETRVRGLPVSGIYDGDSLLGFRCAAADRPGQAADNAPGLDLTDYSRAGRVARCRDPAMNRNRMRSVLLPSWGKAPSGSIRRALQARQRAIPLSRILLALSMGASSSLLAQDTSDSPPFSPSCRAPISDIATPAPLPHLAAALRS